MRVPADKKFGQHFLHSAGIISKIVSSISPDIEAVIEIGPGPGALTREIAPLHQNFFAVEKDQRMLSGLQAYFSPERLYHDDATAFCWEKLLQDHGLTQKKIAVVSNLPYNVGTLIFRNLFTTSAFKTLTLMFQKEVAQKILAPVKTSSLSALSASYFEVQKICDVPPGAFSPPPQVNSSVLFFTRKKTPLLPLTELGPWESFLRTCFRFPRKQLMSNLRSFKKHDLFKLFKEVHIPHQVRAQDLEVEALLALYKKLILSPP